MSVHNKSIIAPVHNHQQRSDYQNVLRNHYKQNESPKMSLFSWLEFEKGSQVASATASIISERPPSRLSNFSGISGLDDEFLRENANRADTVDSGTFSVDTFKQRANGTDYHKIIVDLNNELLNAKTENIQMKFKLDETKAIMEMEWTEKVRRLSNENRNVLEQKMSLEKINEELRGQLSVLKANRSTVCDDNELNELKMKIELLEHDRAKDELELFQNKNLIADLQIMLETKEKSSQNIKEQMIDIHAKNQDLILKIKRMENETSTIMNEIEMLKKSESWYKHELHECQNKKLKLQEDYMSAKNELQLEKNKNNRLYAEFTQLLRNCEDIEAKAIREKESMMRKLENIQANLGASMDKNHLINHVKDVSGRQAAMLMVEELKKELSFVNHKCEQQDTLIKQMEQKSKSYVTNEASLQKQISDQISMISNYEAKAKEFEEKIKILESQRDSISYQNEELKSEHEKLLVHYDAMSAEKSKIDETVKKLREDFEVIMVRFEQISQELSEKEQIVCSLSFENKFLQEKSKDINQNQMKNLMTENQLLKSDFMLCESKISNLEDELSRIKRDVTQKELEITDSKHKIEIKNQEIEVLTESNQVLKQEVTQMINQLQDAFAEIKSKNSKISGLLDLNKTIESDFKSIANVTEEFKTSLDRAEKERNAFKEELKIAYETIEKYSKENLQIQGSVIEHADKAVDVDLISHEIDALKAEIEIMKSDYVERLTKSESNSKALSKKLKEEMKQRQLVEQNVHDKNDLALVNAELQGKLDLFMNKSTILETKCTNLQTEVDKLENERLNLITFMKDNNLLKDDDLILSIMHLNNEIGVLNHKIFEIEETLKKSNVELNHKQHEFVSLQKENDSIKAHLKSITSSAASIANYEAQLLGLQSAIEAKNAENETLNKELQSLHSQIQNITKQCEELKLNQVTSSSQNIELSDTINDLKNQLHSSGLEIQLLEEKCESYKNIERNLVQSKDQLVREMQQLRKELSLEHGEKIELQKLTTELKVALSQLMESNSTNMANGNGKENQTSSLKNISRRTDFSKTIEILEKSAKTKSTSLAPLQECVDSLKQEMDTLNRMIRQNSQIRSEITEMSLMDELRAISER